MLTKIKSFLFWMPFVGIGLTGLTTLTAAAQDKSPMITGTADISVTKGTIISRT